MKTLTADHPTTSADRLACLEHELRSVCHDGVPGDVVELGCYRGGTSAWLQDLLVMLAPTRSLHVYDSFAGMPAPSEYDPYPPEVEGRTAASIDDLIGTFDRFALPLPHIHAGWFRDTLPHGLPAVIAFSYLDSDFYDSVLASLRAVYWRLSVGGVILVDDYADAAVNPRANDAFPGVKRAVDTFLADKPEETEVLVAESELAFGLIRKR